MAKQKYYVVWQGVEPGIYKSWKDCQQQIQGFPNAKYKSFKSEAEAKVAYYGGTAADFIGQNKKPTVKTISEEARQDIVWNSIRVDAACSGNPGIMEYQGVDTKSGYQYFHKKFNLGTNNIGEFLALVHALAMFKKEQKSTPIYTDSKIAMGWIKAKKCRSKLAKTAKTATLWEVVRRAEIWLHNNSFDNPILKWETKVWGEIPADFGRK
ncbi:MAG: ribonuclease H family protein [Bacteroidota bacterium]